MASYVWTAGVRPPTLAAGGVGMDWAAQAAEGGSWFSADDDNDGSHAPPSAKRMAQ